MIARVLASFSGVSIPNHRRTQPPPQAITPTAQGNKKKSQGAVIYTPYLRTEIASRCSWLVNSGPNIWLLIWNDSVMVFLKPIQAFHEVCVKKKAVISPMSIKRMRHTSQECRGPSHQITQFTNETRNSDWLAWPIRAILEWLVPKPMDFPSAFLRAALIVTPNI